MNTKYSLLVKFATCKKHLEEMREGLLYCNTIKHFTEFEDGKVRGDGYEAVIELHNIKKGELLLKPAKDPNAEWKTLNIINAQFKKHYANPLGNLFCLSSISLNPTVEPTVFKFDERFKSFGNYVLLIMQQPVFLKRFKKALRKAKIKGCGKKIEYLDLKKHNGEKTLFQKDLDYSWQEEFRFYFENDKIDILKFSMGSIKDISEIYDLNEQKEFLIMLPSSPEIKP
jgi:hypothetical protein